MKSFISVEGLPSKSMDVKIKKSTIYIKDGGIAANFFFKSTAALLSVGSDF